MKISVSIDLPHGKTGRQNVTGEVVTEHFAITRTLDAWYREHRSWAVTHRQTGRTAVYFIPRKRAAIRLCKLMEAKSAELGVRLGLKTIEGLKRANGAKWGLLEQFRDEQRAIFTSRE